MKNIKGVKLLKETKSSKFVVVDLFVALMILIFLARNIVPKLPFKTFDLFKLKMRFFLSLKRNQSLKDEVHIHGPNC